MTATIDTKTSYFRAPQLALVCLLATANSANAAIVIEHSGTVQAGTTYHSNLQLLDDSVKESTYVYTLVPEYKLSALDDKNKWFGSLGMRFARASNQTIMGNREDPFATLGWERLFENGTLSLLADYTRQSTRNTQFTTTGAVADDGTSVVKHYAAIWDYYISQKLTLSTRGDYQDNIFTGANALGNNSTRALGMALKYAYSEKVKPYVSVLATDYQTEGMVDDVNIRYQTYTAGAEVIVNPRFRYVADLGYVQFNSTADDDVVGKFSATYIGDRYDLTGTVERAVFSSGLGFVDVRNALTTAFNYKLTPRSAWGIDLGITENKSGLDTQSLLGFYSYEMTDTWLLRVEAAERNLKITNQDSADDTSLGVYITYTSPKF